MRTAIDPTTYALMRDVSAGIRVLQTRDGVHLSESQILERARNIVMGLIGNYRIEALAVDRADGRGRGQGHGRERDDDRGADTEAIENATGAHVTALS